MTGRSADLCDDLIFFSRVAATARAAGLIGEAGPAADDAVRPAREQPPAGVIVDLHNAGAGRAGAPGGAAGGVPGDAAGGGLRVARRGRDAAGRPRGRVRPGDAAEPVRGRSWRRDLKRVADYRGPASGPRADLLPMSGHPSQIELLESARTPSREARHALHQDARDRQRLRLRRLLRRPAAGRPRRAEPWRVSDRHFGVGVDGLILICPSERADARMRMFNADGSESEMCGNGLRCVAKYVYDHGIARKPRLGSRPAAGC